MALVVGGTSSSSLPHTLLRLENGSFCTTVQDEVRAEEFDADSCFVGRRALSFPPPASSGTLEIPTAPSGPVALDCGGALMSRTYEQPWWCLLLLGVERSLWDVRVPAVSDLSPSV